MLSNPRSLARRRNIRRLRWGIMNTKWKTITRKTLACAMGAGAIGAAGVLASCASSQASKASTAGNVAGKLEVFDMHCDTVTRDAMAAYPPYSDEGDPIRGTLLSNNGEVSADRMGDARWVQCFAIWMNDNDSKISHIDWYHQSAKWFHEQMEQHSDRFAQARSFAEIPGILDSGKVAAVLTVENAACLDAGFDVVDEFVEDGVLVSGITWNAKNVLGSGIETDEGLTDMGKRYITTLEELGIVVDVSHLNDTGFWELEKIATKPYIATHSNSRAVCGHKRNLTDDQFKAIMARGGLVGLNFHRAFVCEDARLFTFDELAAHVDHWLELGGEDCIALGSDRDGANIPTWLADCNSQPYLFSLFEEKFGESIARKLFSENARKFFK